MSETIKPPSNINPTSSRINRAKNLLNAWQGFSNDAGLDLSHDTVSYYNASEDEDMNIPHQRLRKFKTITSSEKKNQDRLINSLTKDGVLFRKTTQNKYEPTTIDQIKNNERVYLQDYYDVDNGYIDETRNLEPDLYGSLGRFKLRSKSNLEFTKAGDKLLPYGTVEHSVEDTYDFNRGSLLGNIINPAEDAGKAKSYKVKSRWKTSPVGVITIDDNKVNTSDLEWSILE